MLGIEISNDLRLKFKIKTALNHTNMKDVTIEFIKKYVDE